MSLGNRGSFVYGSHHVADRNRSLSGRNDSANAAVRVLLTGSMSVVVDVSQTQVGQLVSEERSVVRGNGGVLTLLVQRNLRSKDGNHRLVLTFSPVVLRNGLDLLGIFHVELHVQDTIGNLPALNAQTSVSLGGRTGVLEPLVAREHVNRCEVIGVHVRGVQVVLSPQILNESHLRAVVAVVYGASGCSSKVDACLFLLVEVAASFLLVPSSSGNILEGVSLEVVEAGSFDTVVVAIGNEHEAAEAVLHEHVQHVHLSLQSVNLLREFIELLFQLRDFLIGVSLRVGDSLSLSLGDSVGELFLHFVHGRGELSLQTGDLLLKLLLVGSLQVIVLDSLDTGLELLHSVKLLLEVQNGSLASRNLVFQTLLQIFDSLEVFAKILFDGLELSVDLSNLLVELALVELVVLKVGNQTIDFLQRILGSLHASLKTSDSTSQLNKISFEGLDLVSIGVHVFAKIRNLTLNGCDLTLSSLNTTLQSVNLTLKVGLSVVQSVQIGRDLFLQVLDVVIVVLAGRQRCGSDCECSQHHQKA